MLETLLVWMLMPHQKHWQWEKDLPLVSNLSPVWHFCQSYGRMPAAHILDTQAPLDLRSSKPYLSREWVSANSPPLPGSCRLVLDLLSVHLIRRRHGSTIISFHPSLNLPTTTAPYLHERIRFAGKSYCVCFVDKETDILTVDRTKCILAKYIP